MSQYREIIINGVWKQNPGMVQILGMCPVLAISTNITNALGLGLATTLVMAFSNAGVSLVRNHITADTRIPVFILIIASMVTIIDMTMNAFVHPLYLVLGIFIPLIVTNCIVLARTEAFASRNTFWPSALDGMMMGLGVTVVLVMLGAIRELIGKGTLLSGIDLALGPVAKHWVIHVIPDYPGFLLSILPPGAFFGLGLIIAARNWLDQRSKVAAQPPARAIEASEAAA